MPRCIFCKGPNPQARVDIGYEHCTGRNCVAEWRRRRNDEKGLVLVLAHKQGLMWTTKDKVPDNDMTRQGGK